MTSKSDSPVYAEANEAFEMERNRCYSTVITSSNISQNSSSNRHDYFIAIVVLILATLLVLAATSACAIVTLVQNSNLDGRITSLSANTEFSHENSLLLEDNILELRQNYSQLLNIVTYFSRNFEELMQNYSQNYTQLLWEFQQLRSQLLDRCPSFIPSCSSLYPSCPSDYYQVRASNGSVVHVYCDMTLSCGNITGGWMRVAELNMTDTSQHCPGELMEINNDSIRRCETMNKGCSPITYPTQNSYTKVCGRITAYQVGTTNAFFKYYDNRATTNINSTYVDGVSLTRGNPREHIWTFAAALDKAGTVSMDGARSRHCPCQFEEDPPMPPPFVGEDYFCDAGNEEFMNGEIGLQTDPLWDGTDCLCCNNSPWFYKQLPQSTTDDIEMRVCRDEINENIGIQEIEIYVQ